MSVVQAVLEQRISEWATERTRDWGRMVYDALYRNAVLLDLAASIGLVFTTWVKERADRRLWLVWNNQSRIWWAADRMGYRARIEEAGRYTLAEAVSKCSLRSREGFPPEVMVPSPEYLEELGLSAPPQFQAPTWPPKDIGLMVKEAVEAMPHGAMPHGAKGREFISRTCRGCGGYVIPAKGQLYAPEICRSCERDERIKELEREVEKERGHYRVAISNMEAKETAILQLEKKLFRAEATGRLKGRLLSIASDRAEKLADAIKAHRGQKADDRCWEDDQALYLALGDGEPMDNRVGDRQAMLMNCVRFIENRCAGGAWVTYAELEYRANKAALDKALALVDTRAAEQQLEKAQESLDVMQDDLAALLSALDMGTHARPQSPHEVMLEAVASVVRLKELTHQQADTIRRNFDQYAAEFNRLKAELDYTGGKLAEANRLIEELETQVPALGKKIADGVALQGRLARQIERAADRLHGLAEAMKKGHPPSGDGIRLLGLELRQALAVPVTSGIDWGKGDVTRIPMLLWCPRCQTQHVDEPEPETGWTNPPHRTHKCKWCGHLWRPSDWPTTGVAAIDTGSTVSARPYHPSPAQGARDLAEALSKDPSNVPQAPLEDGGGGNPTEGGGGQ